MSRSAPVGPALWDALRRHCLPGEAGTAIREAVRVDRLAREIGASEGTCRKYLREWAVADLVEWPAREPGTADGKPRGGRHLVRLLSERPDAPTLTYDCGGSYVYLRWPDDDEYWTINYNGCPKPHSASAVPVVHRRSRRGDVSVCDEPAETGDDPPATALAVPDPAGAADPLPEPASWDPQPEVLAAAARIRSLHETALALAASIEAQVMEALHEIRQAAPDEAAFRWVVAEMTPILPAEAVRMAATWDVARRQRSLRELAECRPREAMSLVRGLAEAGVDAEQFTSDDAAVAEVLALPPRRRNARLRALIAAETESGQPARDPADAERIAELEVRVEALSQPPAPHPGQRWREVVVRAAEAERVLSEVATTVADLVGARSGTPAAQATRLFSLSDSAQASLDAITGALLGESPGSAS